jgi:precorrin-3B synthase
MATGDGLLVRVKPPNATLAGDAARQLGLAAMRYGNGVIELTSRARIQVRGLQRNGIGSFAAAMVAAGLADANPQVERRRAVIVPPLADAAVYAVASEVETALCREPRLATLPTKFVVAVDGSETLPLGDIGADIHVVRGNLTCIIALKAREETEAVAPADAAAAVVRLALALLDHPIRHRPPPWVPRAIGWLPGGAFGMGLPLGATTATTLVSLADLSQRYGDGTLRVTPWRACIIPAVSFAARPDICAAGEDIGLIVDMADPRLAVVACPGQPACSSATVPARADALRLAELDLPATVHVSGCAKGCAHPGPARITLIGESGRYGIVHNGGPGDTPSVRGLTYAQVIEALQS